MQREFLAPNGNINVDVPLDCCISIGQSRAGQCNVSNDATVVRLRVQFLEGALLRVRELALQGEAVDARIATEELRRYFESVRNSLACDERDSLHEQIRALSECCGLTDRMENPPDSK
jgi:hypothetical protein